MDRTMILLGGVAAGVLVVAVRSFWRQSQFVMVPYVQSGRPRRRQLAPSPPPWHSAIPSYPTLFCASGGVTSEMFFG
jgi:hypothetical protein